MAIRQLLNESAYLPLEKSITITFPEQGDTVSGYVKITAEAKGESSVRFYVDGVQIPGATYANGEWYIDNIDTTQVSDGTHTLRADATYTDNTSGTTSLTVTVNNAVVVPPDPPDDLPFQVSEGSRTLVTGSTDYYDQTVVIASDIPSQSDQARMFTPTNVNNGDTVTVIWHFHGAGGDHNSIAGGHSGTAISSVSRGAIAIELNLGGARYTHPSAQTMFMNAYLYMSKRYNISKNYLRATSHGGALSTWIYGNNKIPNIKGLFAGIGVYNIQEYVVWGSIFGMQGPSGTVSYAFSNNKTLAANNNPKNFSRQQFTGKNVSLFVDPDNDNTVNASAHGISFYNNCRAVSGKGGGNFAINYHDFGHHEAPPSGYTGSLPGNLCTTLFVSSVNSWGGFAP